MFKPRFRRIDRPPPNIARWQADPLSGLLSAEPVSLPRGLSSVVGESSLEAFARDFNAAWRRHAEPVIGGVWMYLGKPSLVLIFCVCLPYITDTIPGVHKSRVATWLLFVAFVLLGVLLFGWLRRRAFQRARQAKANLEDAVRRQVREFVRSVAEPSGIELKYGYRKAYRLLMPSYWVFHFDFMRVTDMSGMVYEEDEHEVLQTVEDLPHGEDVPLVQVHERDSFV